MFASPCPIPHSTGAVLTFPPTSTPRNSHLGGKGGEGSPGLRRWGDGVGLVVGGALAPARGGDSQGFGAIPTACDYHERIYYEKRLQNGRRYLSSYGWGGNGGRKGCVFLRNRSPKSHKVLLKHGICTHRARRRRRASRKQQRRRPSLSLNNSWPGKAVVWLEGRGGRNKFRGKGERMA